MAVQLTIMDMHTGVIDAVKHETAGAPNNARSSPLNSVPATRWLLAGSFGTQLPRVCSFMRTGADLRRNSIDNVSTEPLGRCCQAGLGGSLQRGRELTAPTAGESCAAAYVSQRAALGRNFDCGSVTATAPPQRRGEGGAAAQASWTKCRGHGRGRSRGQDRGQLVLVQAVHLS